MLPLVALIGALSGGFVTWRTGRFWWNQPRRGEYTNVARTMSNLMQARRGLPNKGQATRTLAVATVSPAAIAGIAIGTRLVDETAPGTQLLLVGTATAFAAGFASLAIVWAVYRRFGFRPIVTLANLLIGGFAGFFAGAILGNVLDAWWPWLLGPIGVLVGARIPNPPAANDAETTAAERGAIDPVNPGEHSLPGR